MFSIMYFHGLPRVAQPAGLAKWGRRTQLAPRTVPKNSNDHLLPFPAAAPSAHAYIALSHLPYSYKCPMHQMQYSYIHSMADCKKKKNPADANAWPGMELCWGRGKHDDTVRVRSSNTLNTEMQRVLVDSTRKAEWNLYSHITTKIIFVKGSSSPFYC